MAHTAKQTAKRYTAEEKRAYYMGVGACIGHSRAVKQITKKMSPVEKQSFFNGFDRALIECRGIKKQK